MIKKNNKWREKFTKWVACSDRYPLPQTGYPTTWWLKTAVIDYFSKTAVIDYFSWFCGLIGIGSCEVPHLATGHCCRPPLTPDYTVWPSFAVISRFSFWRGIWISRGDVTLYLHHTSNIPLKSSDHMTKPGDRVGRSYHKSEDAGGYGPSEATAGYQDGFGWSNRS